MNRAPFEAAHEDLHVDDVVWRNKIKTFFLGEQKRRMEYDRDISARVGRGRGWVHSTWMGEHWQLSTIQLMARAFEYELRFEPVMSHEVWLKLDKDAMWRLAAYAANRSPEEQDEAARRDLCELFRLIREAAGIDAGALARRLGLERNKLLSWEAGDRPNYTVTMVQRMFRALGAPLKFSLEDGKGEAVDFPPTRDEDAIRAVWRMRSGVNVVVRGDEVWVWNSMFPDQVARFPKDAWEVAAVARTSDASA